MRGPSGTIIMRFLRYLRNMLAVAFVAVVVVCWADQKPSPTQRERAFLANRAFVGLKIDKPRMRPHVNGGTAPSHGEAITDAR